MVSGVEHKFVLPQFDSNLNLKVNHLRKDFEGFMKHVIILFELYQTLKNGFESYRLKKIENRNRGRIPRAFSIRYGLEKAGTSSCKSESGNNTDHSKRQPRPCSYSECEQNDRGNWIDNCTSTTDSKRAKKNHVYCS